MSHEKIQKVLCVVLRDMGVVEPKVQLERPRDPSHGDVASNVAMTLARELKRAPREIAKQIVEQLDFEVAGNTGTVIIVVLVAHFTVGGRPQITVL